MYRRHRAGFGTRIYKSKAWPKSRKGRALFGPVGRTARVAGRRGFTRTAGFYGRYRGGPNGSGELKFFDLDIDVTPAVAGSITDSINHIPQGVTENTRVGRKCTITNIAWRYDMVLPKATDGNNGSEQVRIIMYLDKQCNGATATVTGILESADYQSFNNLANKSRFRTLMDRTYNLNATAMGGYATGPLFNTAETAMSDSFYKKCSIPLEFDSTTGAITEIRSNNIGLLLISKTALVALTSKIRIRFSDN